MKSFIIGGIIVALGIYLLYKSIKKEVTDGCYACPSKGNCSSCQANKNNNLEIEDEENKE